MVSVAPIEQAVSASTTETPPCMIPAVWSTLSVTGMVASRLSSPMALYSIPSRSITVFLVYLAISSTAGCPNQMLMSRCFLQIWGGTVNQCRTSQVVEAYAALVRAMSMVVFFGGGGSPLRWAMWVSGGVVGTV